MIVRAAAFAGLLFATEAAAWECVSVPTRNRFRGAAAVFEAVVGEPDGRGGGVVRVTEAFKGVRKGDRIAFDAYLPGFAGDEVLIFAHRHDPSRGLATNPCSGSGLLSWPETARILGELRKRARWWRIRY